MVFGYTRIMMQQQIRTAFQFLGIGGLFLGIALFGRVSADTLVENDNWQLTLIIMSAVGVMLIIVGLVLFLVNLVKLHRGGN